MEAEIYPRMTSLINNSKWRRDLLKGCIEGPQYGRRIPILPVFLKLFQFLITSFWVVLYSQEVLQLLLLTYCSTRLFLSYKQTHFIVLMKPENEDGLTYSAVNFLVDYRCCCLWQMVTVEYKFKTTCCLLCW